MTENGFVYFIDDTLHAQWLGGPSTEYSMTIFVDKPIVGSVDHGGY